MRVLFVTDNNSAHSHRFVTKLAAAGHQIFFLDMLGSQTQEAWVTEHVSYVRHRLRLTREFSPESIPDLRLEFEAILAEIRPDLVHAGPVQSCAYLAALSGFHPLVVMSWGSDLLLDAKRGPEWVHATRIALCGADGFVCDCDAVRLSALHYVTLDDSRIAQFPWGITRGSFSPIGPLPSEADALLESNTIRLICTRSWEPIYRIDMLLQAFKKAYNTDSRLRLILAGDGSQRDYVCGFISEHSLSREILTLGRLQPTELSKWFRAAHAHVSCAESDGTSVSLLEAMATGLPVIVTDIPSNREWVRENENGWLAATSADFAQCILRICALSKAERARISARNRETVALRADWDRNFLRLIELYERVVRTVAVA